MCTVVLGFGDFALIAGIVVVALSGLSVYLKPRERARLSRLEGKLDLLLRQAGLTYDPNVQLPPGVLEALQRGEKIQAIKCYREATGVSLVEAKDFIEELQAGPKG